MDEKQKEMLLRAADIFMKFGIKSVNMDDMSRHLGISKKTLYQFVADKHDLVVKAVKQHSLHDDCLIRQISKIEGNAIDQAFDIMDSISGMLGSLHPSVIFDLEKYHPGVFEGMMAERQNSVFECMTLNLHRGKKQGMYRSDLNVDLVVRIYFAATSGMFNPQLFPPGLFDLKTIYLELFRYHIRGIASDSGREYLIEKVKKLKKGL